MMHIEIHIPHIRNPWRVLCVMMIGVWIITGLHGNDDASAHDDHFEHVYEDAMGGTTETQTRIAAQNDADRARITQSVLSKREEILRYNLQKLEEEAARTNNPSTIAELRTQRTILVELIKEKKQSEDLLRRSLTALWDAQGIRFGDIDTTTAIKLSWPIEPRYGISARFKDDAYQARFGIPHNAIDIPIEQGSVIRAPADGVVTAVRDNGLGYSYLTISHSGNIETIYGHVSGFLVEEGEKVQTGNAIALSGGRPGTRGAGLLTTGSHLHFAVKQNGVLVDPLGMLVQWPGLKDFDSNQ